jgi:hypothetical protein
MIPAPVIPRAATPVVAVALLIVAGLGGYLGYSHATPLPGGGDSATTVAPAAIAAKAATPIPDSGPAPLPDEAYIRRIAREEAEAALHPKHAATAPDANDDDDAPDASYQPAPAATRPSATSPATSTPSYAPQNATQPPAG